MEFWVPYGQTEIPVRVPDDNFYKILEPAKPSNSRDVVTAVKTALAGPVDGLSLSRMSVQDNDAAIIVDSSVGSSADTFVACLKTELSSLNARTVRTYPWKGRDDHQTQSSSSSEHRILDPSKGLFKTIGTTSAGTPVSIYQELLESKFKICISVVSPHFATGFKGGPENILPGSSSAESIAKNQGLILRGIPPPGEWQQSATLADAFEACKIVGDIYNLCVVPDGWGGVDSVFAGGLDAAFKAGVERYAQVHRPQADRRADVVVVAAGPVLGTDLYDSVTVLSNVWEVVKKEGTIILVAECAQGIGNETFLELARRFSEKKELLSELKHDFQAGGQVNVLLKEALERNRIQLVSVLPDHYSRSAFGLKPSRTASGAIQQAIRVEGKDSRILIVTRGDILLPTLSAS